MSDPQGRARHWRLDWRLLLFTALFLPLLVALGFWQLERAGEKESMIAQWQQDALELAWPDMVAEGLYPGRPVTLTGLYGDRSWLLDNRTRDGRPGYEVLTAFYPVAGPPVLVNRGWLPAPRTRDQLPDFATPQGVFEISGRLSGYPEPPVLAERPVGRDEWPRRVQSLSREVAAADIKSLPGAILRLSGETEPGAFRADWEPDLMGPETHYGYAIQWFALAVALTILTVVASYRKTGANNDNDDG